MRHARDSKMSEDELEHLKRKVEELEKKIESIVMVINVTNQGFMKLFDRMMTYTEKTISLLEQLPKSMVKEVVEQLKKDFEENKKMVENARKSIYVV
jgi:methylthioribose-1-phosphate isomerase